MEVYKSEDTMRILRTDEDEKTDDIEETCSTKL